ncbi:MAG: dihydrodipicolinate synthase family protein [Abditibacteriaceae bacterium]
MPTQLQGVLPVLYLPFLENSHVDFETLQAEVDFAYQCGADGVVMAMVTEVLRLRESERCQVAEKLIEFSNGRGVVVISVGAESTFMATELARHAEAAGADAIMAIPPIATALGEEQLRCYFQEVFAATNLPLVVQDASSYVGKPMTAAFQASLFNSLGERVSFKPEAAPVGPVISAIHQLTGNKASIYEGSGGSMLVENYRRGLTGTMCGSDMLDAIVALWRALNTADENRINSIAPLVTSILALAVNLDAYLAIGKHLLRRREIFKNEVVRGPVGFELDAMTCVEVDRLFDLLMNAINE